MTSAVASSTAATNREWPTRVRAVAKRVTGVSSRKLTGVGLCSTAVSLAAPRNPRVRIRSRNAYRPAGRELDSLRRPTRRGCDDKTRCDQRIRTDRPELLPCLPEAGPRLRGRRAERPCRTGRPRAHAQVRLHAWSARPGGRGFGERAHRGREVGAGDL